MAVAAKFRVGIGFLALVFVLTGCADAVQVGTGVLNQTDSSPATPPIPGPEENLSLAVAPLWEAKRPADGKLWTAHAMKVVENDGAALLAGTGDFASFCPSYAHATNAERVGFWVYLVSAVVKYESNFKPTDHYAETSLGIDAVTKLQLFSDGLLQLSYQDVLSYPFCNEFDWSKDQHLAELDPAKTIFDPYKNLTCGIRILNDQVRRKGLLAVRGYWSTLFPPQQNSHSKVPQIQALTSQLEFCR